MCSEIRCHTVSGVLKNNLKIFLDIFQIVPDRSGIAGHLNQAIKLGLPDMSRVENLRCNHQNLQVSHKIRFLSQESIRLSSSHDSQITIPLAIEPSKINVSRVLFSLTGLEFGTTRKKPFKISKNQIQSYSMLKNTTKLTKNLLELAESMKPCDFL